MFYFVDVGRNICVIGKKILDFYPFLKIVSCNYVEKNGKLA